MQTPDAEPATAAPPPKHSPTAPKPSRRRYVWASLAALLLLPAAWVAYGAWFGGNDAEERYILATVERGDVEDAVTATGTLQPRDYVDVGTQVSGQLKIVHVVIGQQVKQGQLLAEIDPTLLQARVDGGNAQIQNQQAQLADKRAQLALAELQLRRQQNMMKDEATTVEALQAAEANLKSLNAQIAAIQALTRQTASTLRGDTANLGYTKIYAPMAGTVVSQTAKQGQTLNANQQAPIVLRIADLSTMTVQTQVSEADVSKLKLNMTVYFTTLGGQNKRWYGKLRQVNPTPTVANNVVLFDALFDVPNDDGALMTQMTAQVFFVIGSARDAVIVPLGALSPVTKPAGAEAPKKDEAKPADGAGTAKPGEPGERRRGGRREGKGVRSGGTAMVKVVNPGGKIEERTVKIGVTNRVSAQVTEGLQPGEQVVAGIKQPDNVERAPAGANKNQMPSGMQPRL